jgi:DedD protein
MATDLPEDTSLKRRARRRLIGAIALVLLAVIVLPMIFDAEKKPLNQDVSIQIPSQGDYVAPAPRPGTVTPPPADAKGEPPKDAKADASKADTPKSDAPKSDAAKAAEAPKSEPAKSEPPKDAKADASKAEAPKAPAKAEPPAKAEAPKALPKSEEQSAKEKADAARALALLNGGAPAPKSEKSAEKAAAGAFIVQVAAFSNEEKVQEARDKLSAAGVKTYAEKVATKSGEVTRVRAGPFPSKEAAEAARGRIAGLGYGGAAVVSR